MLIFVILFIIIKFKPRIFKEMVEKASEETEFGQTYFEIYDRSTTDECDRLIIVQPFYWHIWAKFGSVYVLNESNQSCPVNYTPASIVPTKVDNSYYSFKSVCINSLYSDIVTSYTNTIAPVKVKFEITEIQSEKNKFTILDALNELFKNYITMDSESHIEPRLFNINNHKVIKPIDLVHITSPKELTNLDKYRISKVLRKVK